MLWSARKAYFEERDLTDDCLVAVCKTEFSVWRKEVVCKKGGFSVNGFPKKIKTVV